MPVSLAKPAAPARRATDYGAPVCWVSLNPNAAALARRAKAQARDARYYANVRRVTRLGRIAGLGDTLCNALGVAGGAVAALVMVAALAMATGVLSAALVPYAVTASLTAAALFAAYMVAGLAAGAARACYNRARRARY